MTHRRIRVGLLVALLVGAAVWANVRLHSSATPLILHTVPLPGQPLSVAIDTRTGHAFVTAQDTRTLRGGGSVSIIDTVTGQRLRTVSVGTNPQAVAVVDHTARAFVLNAGYGGTRYSVSVIDTHSETLVRTVAVTGVRPDAITVDERTAHVFIVNAGPVSRAGRGMGKGSVVMLDARSGAVLRTTPVGQNPGSIAVDKATGRVFVVNNGATVMSPGSVSVLNAATGARFSTVTVGRGAGAVVVDERAGRVFVSSQIAVHVLDARMGAVLHAVPVRGGLLTVDEQASRVFVVDSRDGTVSILDAHNGRVLHMAPRAVPAGDSPIAIAVNEQRRRLFVIADNGDGGSVSILDAQTGTPRRTLVTGNDPAAVAVDAHTERAILATVGDGALRASQAWRVVPQWLRWLPFLPHAEPPKVPGSVSVLDATR